MQKYKNAERYEPEINIHSKKLPRTNIGIGIHTVEVVARNICTTIRLQYSITGIVVFWLQGLNIRPVAHSLEE
jgi:hypothetical protein